LPAGVFLSGGLPLEATVAPAVAAFVGPEIISAIRGAIVLDV